VIDAAASSWMDVALALRGRPAILPFGALEQHGPHLPLATDTVTAEAVASALAERLSGVLLPAIPYGETWNNAGYPGTVSLSPSTVTAIAMDIARAVLDAGASALIVVNGDWGNRAPLAAAAHLLATEGLPCHLLDYPGMEDAADGVQESPLAAPGLSLRHAEEIETSLMLAIAPQLVRMERATAEYPDFPADFGTRPMQLHPFSRSGTFGDARPATAAKGHAVLAATIDASEAEVRAFLAGLGASSPASDRPLSS
jgi:creatinine amidohydrolase